MNWIIHLIVIGFVTATLPWALLDRALALGMPSGQAGHGTPEAPSVACSASEPVVTEGKSARLMAWALSPTDQALEYGWTADAGRINGNGREVEWEFSGVGSNPQPHQAAVTVSFPSRASAVCSLQVIVAEPERGKRVTGRSLLVKGKKEVAGYGLYSYLLLGSRPVDSSRERCLTAVRAYLAGMEDVTKLQDYIPAPKLNVAYLPIETPAPADVTAEWLLEHYDFARAAALLQALPGDLTEGPYIVSVLKPLALDNRPSQYLFQNLSGVPAKSSDLVSWWIREFLHQAAQEHFWEPKTAELLVVKLRTTIAVLAIGLPDVQKAVAGWVSWMH
jgi:hypothetical protein